MYSAKPARTSSQHSKHTEDLAKDSLRKVIETSKLTTVLDLNLAQAYLKVANSTEAAEFCRMALEREPRNEKALYRKASAELMSEDVKEARNTLHVLLEFAPEHGLQNVG